MGKKLVIVYCGINSYIPLVNLCEICYDEQNLPMISLRPALADDCPLWYLWRLDPEAQASFFTRQPLLLQDHEAWFHASLKNSNRRLWTILQENNPIGSLRVDREGTQGIVSILLVSSVRHLGIGPEVLTLLEKTIHDHWPDMTTLAGFIRPENHASRRAFEKAGYTQRSVEYVQPLVHFMNP